MSGARARTRPQRKGTNQQASQCVDRELNFFLFFLLTDRQQTAELNLISAHLQTAGTMHRRKCNIIQALHLHGAKNKWRQLVLYLVLMWEPEPESDGCSA